MKTERKTTEFWTVAIGLLIWLADRHFGTNFLDSINLETLTEAKAQVAVIAGQLQAATGSDSNLILYAAGLVYVLRKAEKITAILKGDGNGNP